MQATDQGDNGVDDHDRARGFLRPTSSPHDKGEGRATAQEEASGTHTGDGGDGDDGRQQQSDGGQQQQQQNINNNRRAKSEEENGHNSDGAHGTSNPVAVTPFDPSSGSPFIDLTMSDDDDDGWEDTLLPVGGDTTTERSTSGKNGRVEEVGEHGTDELLSRESRSSGNDDGDEEGQSSAVGAISVGGVSSDHPDKATEVTERQGGAEDRSSKNGDGDDGNRPSGCGVASTHDEAEGSGTGDGTVDDDDGTADGDGRVEMSAAAAVDGGEETDSRPRQDDLPPLRRDRGGGWALGLLDDSSGPYEPPPDDAPVAAATEVGKTPASPASSSATMTSTSSTTESESSLEKTTKTTTKEKKGGTRERWSCDFCETSFGSYDEACRHEESCHLRGHVNEAAEGDGDGDEKEEDEKEAKKMTVPTTANGGDESLPQPEQASVAAAKEASSSNAATTAYVAPSNVGRSEQQLEKSSSGGAAAAAMMRGGEVDISDEGGMRWECHKCTFHNELNRMRCYECRSWKGGTRDSTPQSTVGCKIVVAPEGSSKRSNRKDIPIADVVNGDKAKALANIGIELLSQLDERVSLSDFFSVDDCRFLAGEHGVVRSSQLLIHDGEVQIPTIGHAQRFTEWIASPQFSACMRLKSRRPVAGGGPSSRRGSIDSLSTTSDGDRKRRPSSSDTKRAAKKRRDQCSSTCKEAGMFLEGGASDDVSDVATPAASSFGPLTGSADADDAQAFHNALESFQSGFLPAAREILDRKKSWETQLTNGTVGKFWVDSATKFHSLTLKLESFIDLRTELLDPSDNACLRFIMFLVVITDVLGRALLFHGLETTEGSTSPTSVCNVAVPSRTLLWDLVLGFWDDETDKCRTGIIRHMSLVAICSLYNERMNRAIAASKKVASFLDDELDRCLGFTFGLHMIVTLAKNIYEDAFTEAVQSCGTNASSSEASMSSKRRNVDGMSEGTVNRYFRGRVSLEQCALCDKEGQIIQCDGCAGCFHLNDRRSLKDCLGDFVKEDEEDVSGNRKSAWLCPICSAGEELIVASEANELGRMNDLILFKVASPFFQRTCLRRGENDIIPLETTTPLHISCSQNNYDLCSMLLYGAFVLLQDMDNRELVSAQFPTRCWGRDGRGHIPFDSAMRQSMSNLDVTAPIESLLLLCARGGGDQTKVSKLPELRWKLKCAQKDLMKALVGGADPVEFGSGEGRKEKIGSTGVHPVRFILPCDDISLGSETFPVPWVNDVDKAVLSNFVYINQPVESISSGVSWFRSRNPGLSNNKMLVSWKDVEKADRCKVKTRGGFETRQSIPDQWLCECNYLSPCSEKRCPVTKYNGRRDVLDCGNRALSVGANYRFEVFRTKNRGWGLRTAPGQFIKKGSLICEYSGVYLTENEVSDLETEYKKEHLPSLIFNLKKDKGNPKTKGSGNSFAIDGTRFRSLSGFINHTCEEPNVQVKMCLSNHLDIRFPRMGFMAKTDIVPLSELLFNYGETVKDHCFLCNKHHCLCQGCMRKIHSDATKGDEWDALFTRKPREIKG